MSKFHNYDANSLGGKNVSMNDYAGKTILVVNTASACGLTPQYEGLEKLYQAHKEEGLVILGFPCNQFGGQEPGDAESISSNCLVNYGVSFPMFEKVNVNGPDSHPIFQYLRQEKPADEPNSKSADLIAGTKGMREEFDSSDIIWNFGKFLIDKEGNVVSRFSPLTTPEEIESNISNML